MNKLELLSRITIDPDQCGGRPCIRGMRIRVIDLFELLAAGESPEAILTEYPYLEPDDIAAILLYAARNAGTTDSWRSPHSHPDGVRPSPSRPGPAGRGR